MGDELRRLMHVLDTSGGEDGAPAGECSPPCDVVETEAGIELTMDLPGVSPESVQVVFSHNTLVVAGQKRPGGCEHREAAFHLAERTFGRFARAARLTGAFDAGRADARLTAGELRIFLPRIEDRRGAEMRIPVRAD